MYKCESCGELVPFLVLDKYLLEMCCDACARSNEEILSDYDEEIT